MPDRKAQIALAEKFTASGDHADAARIWESLWPFTETMHAYKYINALLAAGLAVEAENALVDALEAFPNSYSLQRLYAQRLEARDEMERAATYYTYLHLRWPQFETSWTDVIRLLQALGKRGEADALLAAAVQKFPESMECARLKAESACQRRAWPEALELWGTFRERFPTSSLGLRRSIDVCLSMGNLKEADRLARQMHPGAEVVCGSCFIRRKKDSPHLLIGFSAYDIKLGDWPGDNKFYVPAHFDANIIIVNDVRKHWYMDGIYGLGTDFDSSVTRLREIKDSLLGKDGICVCYGNSMGGYGACLYGGLLGADVCFAPGLQALSPNPIGTFRQYSGRRRRLEEVVATSPHTLFHAVAGEKFLGDCFGNLKLKSYANVFVQTVKNFSHGVTGYVNIRKSVRTVLKHYFSVAKKYRYANGSDYIRHSQIYDCVDAADTGHLLDHVQIATWLYSSEIQLRRTTDPVKLDRTARKLTSITEILPKDYIKGYCYEMLAKIYHKLGDVTRAHQHAIHALRYNPKDAFIHEWLATLWQASSPQKALFYASKANHLRDTDMMQAWLAPVRAYDIAISTLNTMGLPECALEMAEEYLQRKGLTSTDRKNIHAARKKCYSQDRPNPWSRLIWGNETWRFVTLSHLYEWAGDTMAAAETLHVVVEQRPQDMTLRLKYIDLLRSADQDDAAFAAAQAAVLFHPWGPGYRRCSQICHARGQREQALQLALAAREAEPANKFHSIWLGQLYAEDGEYATADVYAREALEDSRTKAEADKLLQRIADKTFSRTSPTKNSKKPTINNYRLCEALKFAIDLAATQEEQCMLRIRLARHLQDSSFAKALKVVQEVLDKQPNCKEAVTLFHKIHKAQRHWMQEHQS